MEVDKKVEKERPNYIEKVENDGDLSDETGEDISSEVGSEVKSSKIGYLNPTFDREKGSEDREMSRASTNSYKAAISQNLEF